MSENKGMRQLSKMLAKQFEDKFYELAIRELEEDGFLNQSDYKTCRARALDACLMAVDPVIDTLGLAIAVSREKDHKENTLNEQAELLASNANPEVTTRSWWSN